MINRAPAPAEPGSSAWELGRARLAILFLVVLGVALLCSGGHTYAIDNEVQFQTTRSLVQLEDGLESTDSIWLASPVGPYRMIDGEPVGIVGVGESVLSAPLYVTARGIGQLLPEQERDQFVRTVVFLTNAVLLAASAVVVALLAFELSADLSTSTLLGYAFALCTYAFPNSKTYFTEIGTGLFVALGAYLVIRAVRTRSPRLHASAGGALGFAVMIRPSAGLFLPLVGLFVVSGAMTRSQLRQAARSVAAFGAGATVLLVVFAGLNWWRFGSPFDLGYETVNQAFPLIEGVVNQLFSPGKSFFLYAPIVVLAPVGFALAVRRLPFESLLLAGIVVVNFVFFGRVSFWSGDAAFGPRYALIVLAPAVSLCAPATRLLWGRRAAVLLMVFGAIVSVLGSAVYFNVYYVDAYAELAGDLDRMHHEAAWNPVLGQLEMLPEAIRGSLGWDRPDDPDLGPYSSDPSTHYSYFTKAPRLDFWWLWVGPTGGSPLTYALLAIPAAALAAAGSIARVGVGSARDPDQLLGSVRTAAE